MRSHAQAGTAGSRRGRTTTGALAAPFCALAVAFALLACFTAPASAEAPPLLWQAGEAGSGAGQTSIPRGVAADPSNGNVFVADQLNRRVDEFNALGAFEKTWGWDVVASGPDNAGTGFETCVPTKGDVCKAGVLGAGAGQFFAAMGIALDSSGDVYVVDSSNERVQKFDPGEKPSDPVQFKLMFGGGVDQGGGTPANPGNLCTAAYLANGDVCGAGTIGSGNGQFGWGEPGSFIAIDSADKVYVGDQERIQRFNTAGEYQASLPLPGKTVTSLAVDSEGNLYAGYKEEANVHKLSPAGAPLSPTFKVIAKGLSGIPHEFTPNAVAVASNGHVFALGPTTVEGNHPSPIFEFDPAGNLLNNFGTGELVDSSGLATNLCAGSEAPGNLYVTNTSSSKAFLRAYGTQPLGCFKARTLEAEPVAETTATLNGTVNPNGSLSAECRFEYSIDTSFSHIATCAESAGEIGTGTKPVHVHANVGSLTKGTVYHVRLVAKVGGVLESGSDVPFKTLGPPVISDDLTASVAYTGASLKAQVNPEGFPATYFFEYGTDTGYGHSTPTQAAGSDRTEHPAATDLAGLSPGTTYHWRIVAVNSSGTTHGEDHAFITYRQFSPETECPNQELRSGPSAQLPDCRAYEMVTPVDKNGADILPQNVQTAVAGGAITYAAPFASFGDQLASLPEDQYLATRGSEGWTNHGIDPPIEDRVVASGNFLNGLKFMGFTPDLCSGWLLDPLTPALTPEGQDEYNNIYRRQNCGEAAGQFEAVTTAAPPSGTSTEYVNSDIIGIVGVSGYSDDARHVFFSANAALTPDAAAGKLPQIYDRFAGALHLVSVQPNGTPAPQESGIGAGSSSYNRAGAVSADGSRVYWTTGGGLSAGAPGTIYVRRHPEQGVVAGECTGPASACTFAVSKPGEGFFWTAASDGSKALYGEAKEGSGSAGTEKLFQFDLDKAENGEPAQTLIATKVTGVLGASPDLSQVYFTSTAVLAPGQKDGKGEEAQVGQPNLYLEEGGALTFIATLIPSDIGLGPNEGEGFIYEVESIFPRRRPTRVSSSGALVFESRAQLTKYDNSDARSDEADLEVYSYRPGGRLLCVSCNPSGARPSGRELHESFEVGVPETTHVMAAARIPTWEPHHLNVSGALSNDGGRIFFNSFDALVPRDTNGVQDVYEWEAPGEGRCTEESAGYHEANGGCIYLLSSGESTYQSTFVDASPDGRDVFFTTASSLLPQDTGLVDIYDARIEGGFPQPSKAPACEGEACQSPPGSPANATPASATYRGPGNLSEAAKRCAKGKRKVRRGGKARCVKRHSKQHKHKHKHHQRRANHNRRASR